MKYVVVIAALLITTVEREVKVFANDFLTVNPQ